MQSGRSRVSMAPAAAAPIPGMFFSRRSDRALRPVVLVEKVFERRPGMWGQLKGQDALQIGPLARDMGRESGQDVLGRRAFGKAVEDAPPVLAENVREHAAHRVSNPCGRAQS